MPDRDEYIPGVPCWVDTAQPDPDAAAAFYGGLFGWELEDTMPPDAPGRYLMARIRGRDVAAISSQQQEGPAVWQTYVAVDRAEEIVERAREAGGSVLSEPFDVFDAGRMAVLRDHEGATINLWQAGRHHGSGVVNEHGAVNFNDLHSADFDAAARFYGAVFGWGLLDLGGDSKLWTLPGYGDYLEERNPGMRANMADMGAPGFEEVVATIQPLAGGAPAHWGVTFAVDDADAAAARAEDLGGTVVTAPFDAPWVRMTVIRDPGGATFVASQFVPPS